MKRIAIMLCSVGVLFFSCFGQNTDIPQQKERTLPPVSKKIVTPLEVSGKVDTIHFAEPSKGVRPQIFLIGEDGKRYTFLVMATTTIYGPDWKAIALDKLVKDQQVRVHYITNKEGFFIAQSIKPGP
jgi:hypothetical protein